MLGVPRVDEQHLNLTLFKQFEDRDPVNAGGFHYYRVDAAFFEPIGQLMKVAGKSAKAAYRLGRAGGAYCSRMYSGADIYSSRIRMHRRQLGMLVH